MLVPLVCIAAIGTSSSPARADEPPDLQVTKLNNVNGETNFGSPYSWSLTVKNLGGGDATFAAGQTILTDNLPAQATYSDADR